MDFEKLGIFYLGKEFDLKQGQILEQPILYDARDLTTHAVCIGMTGSGKTGLGICLLEEAAIDQVPAIIVDPKGDMTNLLLSFPSLRPEDFRPWINVDDATRKGLPPDEYAAQQAELWKKGLSDWGQGGERIAKMRESVDFRVYTPGSDAGIPVSILQSFKSPQLDWDKDAELLRERIQGVVTGLLGLLGIDADPVQSRENILLSQILETAWRNGESPDLGKLILAIQNPPFSRLGVLNVDTFFPEKDRFALALKLNSLLASPGFQSWLQGDPLDISTFLSAPGGKPRHSIFYIAHLSEPERMFFVTLLLNQLISWMRAQSGTTSLRTLFYMDEIFGYFPPVSAPPSKKPLLTLLKQGRAFGLGLVLCTQNPVDLDYKGLTNAGTWFVGRLQTERDKERLLEGLEGISSGEGGTLDRGQLSTIISSLGKRVFLLHNVHEEAPLTFQTRWALSYLRGPLTREQIRSMGLSDQGEASLSPTPVAPVPSEGLMDVSAVPPSVGTGIESYFLIPRRSSEDIVSQLERESGERIVAEQIQVLYQPCVLGSGQVHFVDSRLNINENRKFMLAGFPGEGAGSIDWTAAERFSQSARDLSATSPEEAVFAELPGNVNSTAELKRERENLENHLYRQERLPLYYSPNLKLHSLPGESEREFRVRLLHLAREARDKEVDELRLKYASKLESLSGRIEKAQLSLERKQDTASSRKTEMVVSIGETLMGLFGGRRSLRSASSGLSKYRMSSSAAGAAKEAEQNVENLKQQLESLQGELEAKINDIQKRWEEHSEAVEDKAIAPRRTDITIEVFGIGWLPFLDVAYRNPAGIRTNRRIPLWSRDEPPKRRE